MISDVELLQRFVDEGAQDAFAELVHRKINPVYAAALRQVGRDAHLAQDVTQGVFLALAQRAPSLKRHPALTGWLHTTTRYLAAKAVRSQRRWQQREERALAMKTSLEGGEPSWEQLRPVIDEALNELSERDREPILLRFFEDRSFTDVGAMIGLTENAARMRVERGLERLRIRLVRRGLTSTTAALTIALTHQPIIATPASLIASVTTVAPAALAGAALGSGSIALTALNSAWPFMTTTKAVIGLATLAAAVGIGAFIGAQSQSSSSPLESGASSTTVVDELRDENARLRREVANLLIAAEPAANARERTMSDPLPGANAKAQQLRVLVELKKRGIANPGIGFVSRSGDISPAFIELFGLTPAEQEKLRQSVHGAREQLALLEAQHAATTRKPDGEVVIQVAAFPEKGGEVYDRFIKAFAETLGPERHEAFIALGIDQVESALGRFGTPQRTIRFSRQSAVNGERRYVVREDYKLPDQFGNSVSSPMTLERIREHAGTIARLLPPDFGP